MNIAKISDLEEIFSNVVSTILALGGVVFFILIISSAFKFLTSGGDPKALEGAKKTITTAVAGVIILAFSFILLKIIENFTGAKVTEFKVTR